MSDKEDFARPHVLGSIFTMEEAAIELHISRRALQDLVKAHPHYALNGHRKLFSEADIRALWEAMRTHAAPTVPNRAPPKPQKQSSADDWARARELLSKPSRSRSKRILK